MTSYTACSILFDNVEGSMASVIAWKADHRDGHICICCFKILKKLDMATSTLASTGSRGRARGLLLVWREELKWKLQINNYLPRHGRGETLEILVDQRPGDRQWTQSQKEETKVKKKKPVIWSLSGLNGNRLAPVCRSNLKDSQCCGPNT